MMWLGWESTHGGWVKAQCFPHLTSLCVSMGEATHFMKRWQWCLPCFLGAHIHHHLDKEVYFCYKKTWFNLTHSKSVIKWHLHIISRDSKEGVECSIVDIESNGSQPALTGDPKFPCPLHTTPLLEVYLLTAKSSRNGCFYNGSICTWV